MASRQAYHARSAYIVHPQKALLLFCPMLWCFFTPLSLLFPIAAHTSKFLPPSAPVSFSFMHVDQMVRSNYLNSLAAHVSFSMIPGSFFFRGAMRLAHMLDCDSPTVFTVVTHASCILVSLVVRTTFCFVFSGVTELF